MGGLALSFHYSRLKVISHGLGLTVAVLGFLQLAQYLFRVDLHIDQFFFHDYLTNVSQFPGRMAPQTALCFLLAGFALCIDRFVQRSTFVVLCRNFCGGLLLVIGLTAMIGFAFHLPFAFTWGSYNAMALHTAAGFILLGTGLLLMSLHPVQTPLMIIGLVGGALALQVYCGILNNQETSLSVNFGADSRDHIQAIEKEFFINHYTLKALGTFFENSEFVSRREFEQYTKRMLEDKEGQIEALEWLPRIPKDQVSVYFERARADGLTDFQFKEVRGNEIYSSLQERAEYYPVLYKQPYATADPVLGVDFATSPVRWEAMQRACNNGQLTSSAMVDLLAGQTSQKVARGYLMFYPIYESQEVRDTSSQQCSSLRGFVAGVFRPKNILDKAMKPLTDTGIDVFLYSAGPDTAQELLVVHKSSLRLDQDDTYSGRLRYSRDFVNAGQRFVIVTMPTSVYIQKYKSSVLIFLFLLILAFTIIAVMFVYSRIKQSAEFESARLKTEFASTVSHELRTPLTVIKGGIDLIADEVIGPINADQKDVVVSIKNNVDRLSRLINDVLDYQKLESNRMKFKFERQDLNALVMACVKEFSLEADKRGLRLVSNLPAEVCFVSADKDKIVQVMYNLLSNAFKFTKEGVVKVSVGKNGHGFVKVMVEDQGPGIKEEDQHKLFQSFSQLESLEERKSGGTGLGLSISKKIIEAHGGTIGVTSQFGQGAVFYFTLKLV